MAAASDRPAAVASGGGAEPAARGASAHRGTRGGGPPGGAGGRPTGDGDGAGDGGDGGGDGGDDGDGGDGGGGAIGWWRRRRWQAAGAAVGAPPPARHRRRRGGWRRRAAGAGPPHRRAGAARRGAGASAAARGALRGRCDETGWGGGGAGGRGASKRGGHGEAGGRGGPGSGGEQRPASEGRARRRDAPASCPGAPRACPRPRSRWSSSSSWGPVVHSRGNAPRHLHHALRGHVAERANGRVGIPSCFHRNAGILQMPRGMESTLLALDAICGGSLHTSSRRMHGCSLSRWPRCRWPPPPAPKRNAGGGGCVGLPDHPPPTMPFRSDGADAHSRSPGADAAAGKGASPTRHRRRGFFFGARRLAPEFARRPPRTPPRSPRAAHDPPACAPYFSCLARVDRHGNGNGCGSGNGTPTSDPPSSTSICAAT